MIEGVFRGAVSYVCNLLGSDTGLRGARLFQDHNWHRVYNAEDRFPFSLPIDFLKSLLDKRGEHRIQSGCASIIALIGADLETNLKSDPRRTHEYC